MENKSIDLLTRKLKNAPQSVLERVIGYVDALIEPSTNVRTYNLTSAQQQILDQQINTSETNYINAETLYTDLKKKSVFLTINNG